MKYNIIGNFQLTIMSILVGLIAGLVVISYMTWQDYKMLPVVTKTRANQCIKVVNFVNGHAFTCSDVDIILRQYRTELDK